MGKRRSRRRRAAHADAPSYLIVSYVPLLRGTAGETFDLERGREVVEHALATDAGHVDAVVWMRDDDGSPWPILVLERADEIFEHLVAWAEGSPSSWFTLRWAGRSDGYALALMPNVSLSVERYRVARRLVAGEEVQANASFKIVFKPVVFSGTKSAISVEMLGALRSRTRVGFVSRRDLPSNPADLDLERVRFVGPIPVERDTSGWLDRALDPAKPDGR